jgi:hypothetical protein
MHPKVGPVETERGGKEGKKANMKYITSVWEKDTRKHAESC